MVVSPSTVHVSLSMGSARAAKAMPINERHRQQRAIMRRRVRLTWFLLELCALLALGRMQPRSPANLRWCLDCTGKADASGQVHSVLGIMDHGSRLALHPRAPAPAQRLGDPGLSVYGLRPVWQARAAVH